MKSIRWFAPWLLAGATACASVMAQQKAAGPTWREAADAVWARAIAAQEAQGRERVAGARQEAARAWTPHAPSVEVSRRNGPSGSNETELALSAPVWLPGQRAAQASAATAEAAAARAARQAARWRLTGDLREAAWNVKSQLAELQAAREQLRLLQSVSADVERRVKAGDLARADSLIARADMLTAEAMVADLEQRHAAALGRWSALTGLPSVPSAEEADSAIPGAEHPELVLARLDLERAERELDSVRRSRRDAPEVAVSWRQERPGTAQPRQDSVGIALRVPFGHDARSGVQEATAQAEVDTARTRLQRAEEQQLIDVRTARSALDTAHRQQAIEATRAALLRERAQLLDKSFRAGETSLPELLRALAAAAQAEGAAVRQRAATGLAQSRLQHSLGVTP